MIRLVRLLQGVQPHLLFTLLDWFTVEDHIKASSNVVVVTLNGGRITICVYWRISFVGIRDADAILRIKLNCLNFAEPYSKPWLLEQ